MFLDDSRTYSRNETEFLRGKLLNWTSSNKIQVQIYGSGKVIENVTVYEIAGIVSRASIGSDVFLHYPYGDFSIPHALLMSHPSRIPLPSADGEMIIYDQETGNPKIKISGDQIILLGDVFIDDGTGPKRVAKVGDQTSDGALIT